MDSFVALTELRKKIITHIVPRKNTQFYFRMKKSHNFLRTKKNAKFHLHIA